MTTSTFHPATVRLLWLHSRGRRRRMWRRFCQPRRLVLSIVACLLAVAWLGNAALTIWLREAASPETLRALLSLGLALYALWHFARAAFFRPESPFDWTVAERELLAAMPLMPRDLVAYQVMSVTVTTILKAGLLTLLLLPDLRSVPLGVVGLLAALLALEMLRIAVSIATWGMGWLTFVVYRVVVVAGLVWGGLEVGGVIVRGNVFSRINVGEGFLERMLDILVQLNASVLGYIALPFQPFIDLILAETITAGNLGLAAAALAIVVGLAVAVSGLYSTTTRRVASRERRNYPMAGATGEVFAGSPQNEFTRTSSAAPRQPLRYRKRCIPRWRGAGALAWRQLVGARRHWGSVSTAMIAPAILACAPCFVIADPYIAFLATMATLAFYTFLLLPIALRFDFHRDLDRLTVLKGLPIAPTAAVVGQMLAPVLIATVFQCVVLAVAVLARSLPLYYLVMAMLVMAPLNVLVFGLENLIYLLYPYRMQQEGLEIFFRTMLTFTGKGLLFAAGLWAMATWGFAAAALTRGASTWTGGTFNAHAVFSAGMAAGMCLFALLAVYGLSRTYRKMDASEDVPR